MTPTKRGGIIDIFPTGAESPLRLDFFGDELDGLRAFDAASQRTIGKLEAALLKPVSEVALSDEAISRFRSAYRVLFAKAGDDDPLYAAVSAGHRHIGMEHWLPLFHEKMETLMDYLPDARVVLDHQCEESLEARMDLIQEYYAARREFADAKPDTGLSHAATTYHPVPPETLFVDRKEWQSLLSLARGEKIGAWSLTEPSAGSDAAGTLTRAEKVDGGWILNGSKTFTTHGSVGDVCVVFAVTDPDGRRHHNVSAFALEKGMDGFRPGKKENKLGCRASDTSEVVMENCFVPDENLLGERGEGFIQALQVLDGGRISIAALGLGTARGAYETALAYAKEREQFGKPIAKFQAIQFGQT